MDKATQKSHSVSNCIACAVQHARLQNTIPLKPVFNGGNNVNLYGSFKQVSEKEFARTQFGKFNALCIASTGKPFTEVALNNIGPMKRVVKDRMKQCTVECNKALAENAVIHVQAQDTSFSKYNKQRLATFFDRPETTAQSKKDKKRLPLKESDCQNSDDFHALCHKLQNWDVGEKFVGSKIANEFHIKGTDAGHKIKLLALDLEANIPGLRVEAKSKRSLKKYDNSEISMPAPPTCKKLKVQEKELIDTNVISVGSPCCPLTVTYYKNGEGDEKTVIGRKYSLTEIRQKLIDKHRHLMRLYSDTQIRKKSKEDILALLSRVSPGAIPEFESKNLQGMQTLLRVCQRNRALWVWSDHSVLIVVGAVYNPLVYLTDDELAKSHKATMTVQEMVEQGEVYIMAHCSSSSADQAGLIPERVVCLDSLSDPIIIEEGLTIHDSLHIFKGDKQSAWFEAGIQRGGYYCCIACGSHVKDFTDFTTIIQAVE